MDHAVTAAIGASVAEVCTMPIDTTKVRLQLKQQGFGRAVPTFMEIVKKEGWKALFRGCGAAVGRQGTYSGLCFGLYNGTGFKRDTYMQKLMVGGSMGAISVAMVNPLDVIKVRMQSGKFGYTNVLSGLKDLVKNEGFKGCAAGVAPAMQRAFVVNAAELATYEQAKQLLAPYFASLPVVTLHFTASLCASAVCVSASNPFDVAKTRLMSTSTPTSLLSVLFTTYRNEGILALYKGSFPNWMRKGPHCTIQFILYEQLKPLYYRMESMLVEKDSEKVLVV
eukprot:TRINITY_DN2188_c1_g1_i1.p1 TRINITY_DN2188_c1_g1~~TRINITY_DN2188_c1_g1_i1.p1  ORF type:complete len:280 (+),score=48.90 TRINITY_DN2188_c1_g1_i1:60-899(+)